MNCCTDYGTCHQGNHCPARQQAIGLMGEAGPEAVMPLSRASTTNTTPPTTSHGGAPGHAHYPWDDVNTVDDEPGTAWYELAGLAVGFLCFQVVVFVLAFTAGALAGMRTC